MNCESLENLYFDIDFDDYIVRMAKKNLLEYDDFKQEVFLEITEAKARTLKECETIVPRIAMRMRRAQIKEAHTSLDAMVEDGADFEDDRDYSTVLA